MSGEYPSLTAHPHSAMRLFHLSSGIIFDPLASMDGLLYAVDEQIDVRIRIGRHHPKPGFSGYRRY